MRSMVEGAHRYALRLIESPLRHRYAMPPPRIGEDLESPVMKLHYYPETDSLYIELKPDAGAETREIADGLNADFASDGTIVGLDIDRASQTLDLSTLETGSLPLRAA